MVLATISGHRRMMMATFHQHWLVLGQLLRNTLFRVACPVGVPFGGVPLIGRISVERRGMRIHVYSLS